ncbi:MAG: hypothetical protein IPO27_12560 [Bacteroidetes bacterium]|nr:hypothetical protein [Bacteroidota bacterium]
MLIHCAFWHPLSASVVYVRRYGKANFTIRTIGDIPVISMAVYHAPLLQLLSKSHTMSGNSTNVSMLMDLVESSISVMAVDNLPCSLPRDASEDLVQN